MTVEELIEQLKKQPPTMDVFVRDDVGSHTSAEVVEVYEIKCSLGHEHSGVVIY